MARTYRDIKYARAMGLLDKKTWALTRDEALVLMGGEERLDFCYADLTNVDMSGIDFAEAISRNVGFCNASLQDADFGECKLNNARFDEVRGLRANFAEVKAKFSNFSGAVMQHANFAQADLSHAKLVKTDLYRANMLNCYLVGADLSGAYLHQANLRGANMVGVKLDRASVYDMDVEGAVGILASGVLGAENLRAYAVDHGYTTYIRFGYYWGVVENFDAHLKRTNGASPSQRRSLDAFIIQAERHFDTQRRDTADFRLKRNDYRGLDAQRD